MQIEITLNANSKRPATPTYVKELLAEAGVPELDFRFKGNVCIFDGDSFDLCKLTRHCYYTSHKFEVA